MNTIEMEELAFELLKRRRKAGLTQHKVVALLGGDISVSRYSRIERGELPISSELRERLMAILKSAA